MRSQFESKPQSIDIDGVIVEHPPFGIQAKRFTRKDNCMPAPGTYNDPRTALEALRKITGLKAVPFGQTALRFDNKMAPASKRLRNPGPAAYRLVGVKKLSAGSDF